MYRQVRSQQRGLGWGTDYPNADINFSIRLSELTKTQVGLQGGPSGPESPRRAADRSGAVSVPVRDGVGSRQRRFLADADAAGLRDYLLKGGFLWVDDFWGPWAWEAFIDEIAKALPPGEFPVAGADRRASDLSHAVSDRDRFRRCRRCSSGGRAGGATSEMDEYSATRAHGAIVDQQGRIMVLMTHNTDIADSWEREGDDPQFFFNFSPNGYAVGLNAVLYSMSH